MAPEAPLVALRMRQLQGRSGQEFWAELVVETAPWHSSDPNWWIVDDDFVEVE